MWRPAVGRAAIIPMGLGWRLLNDGDGEDEESAPLGWSRMVMPDGGAHLFFLPLWLAAGLLGYFAATGTISLA